MAITTAISDLLGVKFSKLIHEIVLVEIAGLQRKTERPKTP